ncbi:MAG: phosphosulfolactate synthase [Chloroflexi bacterium]|nr:phosphosulfolactate synthase [Chloroflexota bacterium]
MALHKIGTMKAFSFVPIAERQHKPRKVGITEVRDWGMGRHALEDLLQSAGEYIDILKMPAGVYRLQDRDYVREKISLCQEYGVQCSTGGFLERVVLAGPDIVYAFLDEARDLGFTVVEVSTGTLVLPQSHKIELVKLVQEYGLKPKPEVAMVYGIMPGQVPGKDYTINPDHMFHEIEQHLEAGAWKVLIESEGITENVAEWRTDVIYQIAARFPMERLQFEAADPMVFTWYVKNFGSEVNLFIDQSQIMELETTRTGVWGKSLTWGRVATFQRKAA